LDDAVDLLTVVVDEVGEVGANAAAEFGVEYRCALGLQVKFAFFIVVFSN
jgi:hypothetical protein